MAERGLELGRRLEDSVFRLLRRLEELKEEKVRLEAECGRLSAELDRQREEVVKARQELVVYKMATTLGGGTAGISKEASAATQDTKRRIALIVREIDKCIALLSR